MHISYRKLNTLLGWVMGIIATIVYILTAEKAGSFWDCGEFISCAYKIQNAHPPGNTLFALVGRIFILFFGNSPEHAAHAVNLLSAISAGISIMFLFWIITFFTRKLVLHLYREDAGEVPQPILVFIAGMLGSGSGIFTDSFWFSAVEGEVYALAACVLLAIVWMMTKWEARANEAGADKYLVFIFLLIGLSTGVHLLDLLVIPVLAMMYYFKRYAGRITNWGIVIAFLVGCAITGFTMSFVLARTISWGAMMDLFFVNTLGLPIYSGFFFFITLLLAVAGGCIIYGRLKNIYALHLGGYLYIMLLLGYSVYNVSIVRSEVAVPINMGNPDNPMALNNYISRAQYGDKPLLYGQVFTAGNALGREGEAYQPQYKDGQTYYAKVVDANGRVHYVPSDKEVVEEFNPQDMMLFPRVWNNKNDGRNTQDFYANWLGIGKVRSKDGRREVYERPPSFVDNMRWFVTYQIGWMYMRYLMWNFVGRQNDIQGLGNVRDANVITGIGFVDNIFLGDQSKLPETIKNHPSRNTLFALPFILGIIGMVFHARKHKSGFFVVVTLFFFTGLAIMLYLNDAGPQPRERDYASAVSFLVFCVWIGMAVIWVYDQLRRRKVKQVGQLFYGAVVLLFLCAPILMAMQEWDDHDRSNKTLARDYAKNILASCDKNAILFTAGDNDTYPLWYVQEVEGFRTDVRVVNTSLLGIDWYIYQLSYKQNESAPFNIIFTDAQITGGNRNYVFINPVPELKDEYIDLKDVLKEAIANEDESFTLRTQDGTRLHFTPTRHFSVPVNRDHALTAGIIEENAPQTKTMNFSLPSGKNILRKDELVMLAILATNDWTRPIHFVSAYDELGFGNYLQKQGMIYKVLPYSVSSNQEGVVNPQSFQLEKSMDLLLNYKSGGLQEGPIYVDETNRMQVLAIRETYADIAGAFAQQGDFDKARKILAQSDTLFPNQHFPYGMVSRYNMHDRASLRLLDAAYKAKDSVLYKKIYLPLRADLEEQITYYNALPPQKGEALYYERDRAQQLLSYMDYLEGLKFKHVTK